MKTRIVLGIALILVGQVVARADNSLDGDQQQALVAAHDRWRAEVGVPGVRWSASLGSAAQQWADHLASRNACAMRHASRDILGDTGENLYWASAIRWSDGRRELQKIAPDKVVDAWGSEIRDYDAASNRCAPGKACGHYTQVVWRDSREIGCAMAQCEDKSQVWVCRYRPAGNVVGLRPY
jgi:pathogenesis-related protein 1